MNPKPVAPVALLACLLGLATALGGCASAYTVKVDAISKATASAVANPGKSFRIAPAAANLDATDLHYKEVVNYVRTALSSHGMYEEPDPAKAEVVVQIDYGMAQPRVKFQTLAMPVFEDSGGRMVTSITNVTDPVTYQNSGPFAVTTYEPPVITVVGTADKVQPVVVYEKYLNVSARTNTTPEEGRAPPEVWSVNVSAEDASKDLRKYLPVLASATADFIGSNTHEEKPVKISEGDDSVSFIKKGM